MPRIEAIYRQLAFVRILQYVSPIVLVGGVYARIHFIKQSK